MTAIPVTKQLPAIINGGRLVRNGLIPSSELYTKVTSGLNHAGLYRRKMFGSYTGRRYQQTSPIFPAGTNTGPTTRFRWRNHTGHATRALRFEVKMALSRGAEDCRVRFAVTIAGGATSHTGYLHYGVTAGTPTDVPNEIGTLVTTLEVDADTTLEIDLLEYDFGRPVSVLIWELAEAADTTTNYYTAPGHPVGTNILDTHRADLLPAWTALMNANANAAWQWSVDKDPITRTLGTYVNVMDSSSTTSTAASPGVTLALTGRQSYSRSTVPFVFAVYGNTAGGGAGKAKVISAAGDIVAITTIGTTLQWYATTVNMATASTKYDLMISGDGLNQCRLYASSLYQKGG
jgi:hypothetical protein